MGKKNRIVVLGSRICKLDLRKNSNKYLFIEIKS